MAPPPGPYSGTSTLALVARVSAVSFGLVYGSVKLKILKLESATSTVAKLPSKKQISTFKAKVKSHKKAEAKEHH